MDELEQLEQFEEEALSEKKSHKSKASIKKKDDENVVRTSFLETPEYILEQLKNATIATDATHAIEGGDYQFLIYNKKTGTTAKVKSFEYRNKVYCPIVDDISRNNGIALPSDISEYKDTQEILDQMHEFLKKYIELPSFYEKFLPNLVLFYWVYESFPFIPYLQFVGRTSTGKSTAMEVLGSICYKPINTTGSLTIASVFRIATSWKGTLLIDEFEKAGENAREMVSFLKSGVSDNLILRTEGDVKKEVKAYAVKAPKIFTSENPISDAGLQSRTIVIKMEKNKRPVPLYRLPHYYDEAQAIRNKLLLWRLRNLKNVDLTKIEYGFPELKFLDKRVQQVITPIYYFSEENTRKDILEFASEQESETKRERRESIHGIIFETLYDIYVKEGIVPLGQISNAINPIGTKFPINEKRIGNVIRKILGFNIIRQGHDNSRVVVLEGQEEKIEELLEYYGIDKNVLSVTQVAQVANVAVEPIDETVQKLFGSKLV